MARLFLDRRFRLLFRERGWLDRFPVCDDRGGHRRHLLFLEVEIEQEGPDAERMKASLALKGISARVEKVSVNDKTYYRVRSGPYNRDQAYSLHTKLRNNNIDSLVIQIKK